MRRAMIATMGALLAWPAAASAQFAVGSPIPASARHVAIKTFSVSVRGGLAVSFHPDPGSGCAALAGCAYSGTVAWTPNGGGELTVVAYTRRGHRHVYADLLIGENGSGSITASTVQRAGGGQCGDEQSNLTDLEATQHGAAETFALRGELLPTRCAGPLPGDLAAVVPRVTVAARRLQAGHMQLDFRARRSFVAHGFAGTLTSTLVVTVGGPLRSAPPPSLPPAPKSRRYRVVTETLHLEGITGSLSPTLTGTSNSDVCVLLDACGLTGTLTVTPKPTFSQAGLTAIGPARRPYRDFLAALGLSRKGRTAGITVFGQADWNDAGTVLASLHQSGSCSDTAPLAHGIVVLGVAGKRVLAGYEPAGAGAFGGAAPLRTRCPGPVVLLNNSLAAASVPRARLGQRAFTIRLRGGGTVQDEGYTVTSRGALSLRFRRGRLSQQFEKYPVL